MESLSSFIGADGINTTLNSGRISINLKPIDERHMSASDVIRRLQSSLQQVQGMHLYMQPVQDITVDDRVSRTQYQYTLEDPDTDELNEWTNKFTAQLQKLPELEDVATDQQTGARAVQLAIDRVTASRLGVAPTTIDNTLLRRLRTAADQHALHAAEPVSRGAGDCAPVAAESGKSRRSLHPVERLIGRHRSGSGHIVLLFGFGIGRIERSNDLGALYAVFAGGQRPGHGAGGRRGGGQRRNQNHVLVGRQCHSAERLHPDARHHRGALDQPSGTVPVGHGVVQSGAERFAGNGHQRHRKGRQESALPCQPAVRLSRAPRRRSTIRFPTKRCSFWPRW